MSQSFVLDASAAIAWASPDEAAPRNIEAAIVDGGAVAPALWVYEVHNVLQVLRLRKRLEGEDLAAAEQAIRAIGVEFDPWRRAAVEQDVCRLAESQGLTVYDASYLELAQRRQLPLATLDEALRKAAKKVKVKLI